MNLFKDGIEKEVTSPKVIERLMRDGWTTDEKASYEDDEGDCIPEETQPKKRGRPAKKED